MNRPSRCSHSQNDHNSEDFKCQAYRERNDSGIMLRGKMKTIAICHYNNIQSNMDVYDAFEIGGIPPIFWTC